MIEIIKLNKYFNKFKKNKLHVINNVNIKMEDNGLVALLGPSGSGKTTLLNTIGGLDKVGSGKIYINNKKITSRFSGKVDKIRNLNIGYIFQDYKLIKDMSVYDNVAIVLKMVGIKNKNEINKRVNYVLEKVGMYRYKNRPAGMLSGGEKQRVGIARAIVKAPNIIIADEPTGNLDSKNSLEIMNIIKAISREKLVILVTHERDLAEFYASRIIEFQDGKITKDYINKNESDLDYQVENRLYLKDFENIQTINDENSEIRIYSDNNSDLKLNIIIKDKNIYIKSENNKKVEVIDENSNIELVDDHYKKINKETIEKYTFNFEDIINKNIKKKYSSIFNVFTLLTSGFKKVLDFSVLKKILLIGFIISSMFVTYSISTIFATLKVEDKDFMNTNKNYLTISINNINVEDYLNFESQEGIKYLLPGNSAISFTLKNKDFYQTSEVMLNMNGSLSSTNMIKNEDLIYGRMPENDYELVIDKMAIENVFENETAKMIGFSEAKDLLNRKISLENMEIFTIVGITDLQSPSIYANENIFINILANTNNNSDYNKMGVMMIEAETSNDGTNVQYLDYKLLEDKITLTKGNLPENDYEVIVNESHKNEMKINKTINAKINDTKLKVVGYYKSQQPIDKYLVNNNTIKYKKIRESDKITVYAENKEKALEYFRGLRLNIKDSYDYSKEEYLKEQKENMQSQLTVSGIILSISLIEIYLMVRSSFLSRIKEIGILRAIGVKKGDIYKMFIGEIIAITTMTSLPGMILMSYILSILSTIKYISSFYLINTGIILFTIAIVYIFNLVVGLIPVFNVIRRTPAEILARHDI